MLSMVDPSIRRPQAICVLPTRELANQIAETAKKLSNHMSISVQLCVPDTCNQQQRKKRKMRAQPSNRLNNKKNIQLILSTLARK